jgi:Uma2 family endonuclease
MSESAPLVTAEELERFTSDDWRYELVEGRVVRMSPVAFEHGRVAMRFAAPLYRYVERHRLGVVMTEVGFKLSANPDTVRAPDVAFIRSDRVPPPHVKGFFAGAPDLAVEVLSPDDFRHDLRRKIEEYLTCGAAVVLVIDPSSRTVRAHRQTMPTAIWQDDADVVDLDDIVPGFTCTIREIFG